MTITLHLKREVELGLLAQAQVSGMTVEEFVLSVVESAVLPPAPPAPSFEQRAAAFEAWSANHRVTPPLSDHAYKHSAA
jgi:hypothetical protein